MAGADAGAVEVIAVHREDLPHDILRDHREDDFRHGDIETHLFTQALVVETGAGEERIETRLPGGEFRGELGDLIIDLAIGHLDLAALDLCPKKRLFHEVSHG